MFNLKLYIYNHLNNYQSCHKIILSLYSMYFHEIISESEKIKNENINFKLIIPLPKKVETYNKSQMSLDEQFEIILKYFYNCGDFSTISNDVNEINCFELLAISEVLQIKCLSDNLSLIILKDFITKANCLKMVLDCIRVNNI